MRRAAYVWRLLDRRDVLILGAVLGAALLVSNGVTWVTVRHQARVERQRECADKITAAAARRGYRVQRVAAILPCEMEAR